MNRLRLALIGLGVLLAFVAIRLDDRRITWVAIGVLALALALRFATARPGASHDRDDSPPDDHSASS